VGKFIQNVRTLGTDLTTSFQDNMEGQLQLEEIRKAQRELNDAFSFRRSINTDVDSSFETTPAKESSSTPAAAAAVAATTEGEATGKKKKIRRRVRKKTPPAEETPPAIAQDVPPAMESNVPDLEMPEPALANANGVQEPQYTDEEAEAIQKEFDRYTMPEDLNGKADWMNDDYDTNVDDAAAQTRFQQQMSNSWNDQILANEDKLSPISTVMNKIALLEEERKTAQDRLEEEFKKRREMDDQFFQQQRELLEDAMRQVQDQAMGLTDDVPPKDSEKASI